MRKIEFVDLKLQHENLKVEIKDAIENVIETSSFLRGVHVGKFEYCFSELLGIKHTVSCANGSDAIYIALRALNVKPGDEVICPSHTWISTAAAVEQIGATVKFCDTENDGYTIDPLKIESLITERTVGVIAVHLFGQAADMENIVQIVKSNNLWLLEDCAQAHLATFNNQMVGSFGDVATFSFYPSKNLGALGDAGAIVTNDTGLAKKCSIIARHGGEVKNQHLIVGINSRMDGLQAAVLNVKLKYLKEWTARRQEIAEFYLKNIRNPKVVLPKVLLRREHVWHLFVLRLENRSKFIDFLHQNGIPTNINYPCILPLTPAFKNRGFDAHQFPISYAHQHEIVSIPIYPELSIEQIEHICLTINNY